MRPCGPRCGGTLAQGLRWGTGVWCRAGGWGLLQPPRHGGAALLGVQCLICTISLALVPTPHGGPWPWEPGHLPLPGGTRGGQGAPSIVGCPLPGCQMGGTAHPKSTRKDTPSRDCSRRGVCCWRRAACDGRGAGDSRVPPGHTRGGPRFCLSLQWPPRAPALRRHRLLSLLRCLSPLLPSILPHGDPVAAVTSMGTSQLMG